METLRKELFGKDADFFESNKKYTIIFNKLDRERSTVEIVITKNDD